MSELWPTIVTASVSAVATVALVISTIAFHRWTRRQRNPRPVYLTGYIERKAARPHTFTIRLALGNAGDIPVIIAGAVVRLCFKSSCFTTLTFEVIVEDPETGEVLSACGIPARRAARVSYGVDISQMQGNLTAAKENLPDRVDLAIMDISGSATSQPTVYRCTLTFIL